MIPQIPESDEDRVSARVRSQESGNSKRNHDFLTCRIEGEGWLYHLRLNRIFARLFVIRYCISNGKARKRPEKNFLSMDHSAETDALSPAPATFSQGTQSYLPNYDNEFLHALDKVPACSQRSLGAVRVAGNRITCFVPCCP